jgi:transposase
MTPAEHIAELEAMVEQQREQIAALLERVHELEARLAKDSHTSGKPPSSDGLARKTKSLRKRSGKKPGGQLGHHGETLRLVGMPDAVVEHRPTVCAGCHRELPHDARVVLRERRQVQDLPPLRLVVTEQQALRVRCPACQAVTAGTFPDEAPRRAQYGPRLRALAV